MKVIPFVHEGLGNSSYLLDVGEGKAILVDPDRSAGRYLEALRNTGLEPAAVLETHLHADFVSGAREVSHHTGAQVYLARDAHSGIPHTGISNGDRLQFHGVEVEVIGSPGHTPEHLSYVVRAPGSPPLLFSGGSLIVGAAARTDLISPEMTEPLTRAQFRTVRQAFSELPDQTVLYPTHGGGSFCSTGSGAERVSTLGREREDNPIFSIDDEDEFVEWFPATFPGAPDYFFRMRAFNQKGPRLRKDVPYPPALDPAEFAGRIGSSLVIDARPKEDFGRAHIAGSLSISLRDSFPVWLGWLAPEDSVLLFVAGSEADVERLVDQSMLVGYERFAGWLRNGMAGWEAAGMDVARLPLVDADRARQRLLEGAAVLDVREPDEYQGGHIEGAVNIPLGSLRRSLPGVPGDRPLLVYCGVGERASTAASILEAAGHRDVVNLDGGIEAWKAAGFKLLR